MRLLLSEDAAALAQLESEVFPDAWGTEHFAELLEREHFLAAGLFGADEAARLDTYAGGYNLAGELEIVNVAVREELRGRGFGSRVFGFFLREAARRGAVRAVLEVRRENAAARALYASYAFRLIGVRKKYYTDTGEDALVLERMLETF
jgi:ribosomal-protein-alanine N-acetyltransferase